MFNAVNNYYKMRGTYEYTWNTLRTFGQLSEKRIWKNFKYLIDWMEENFTTKYFFTIIGKSYDLDDSILYRIERKEDKKRSKEGDASTEKTVESWLMSNIFRYVENPEKNKNPTEKYVGKVKFQKVSDK